MNWYVIEASVNFLQLFVIYKTFDLYYEKRFDKKFVIECMVVLMTILLSILNYVIPIDLNPYVYISFFFIIYVTIIIIYKGNIFAKMGTFFFLIAFLGTCELMSAVLLTIIDGVDLKLIQEQNFLRFEVMIISQTLFVYGYMFMKKRIDKERLKLPNSRYYFLIASILFLTVTTIVMVIWMYGNVDGINNTLVVLTLSVSLISITSIALTNRIIKDMDEKHKNDLELQRIKMENNYFSDVNSVLEEIRILRHDMRGELVIIHGYNEMNQRDKISSHIEKKLQELDIQLLPKMDSDNILTSFINFKLKEAKSHNIEIILESNLTEENEINIDKEDICRVLNNIINNAIEACENVEEKYIRLQIDMISNSLVIKSENPFKGEVKKEGNKIITLKRDKARHGYGLKSVRGIAEKHGGFMNINHGSNIFILEVHMIVKM
ncbi:MAG TPA: hypothetical protein DC038_06700 [Clostridiales bacterium]|nr:hypothetical protein [Clostridiales bacterium]